MGIGIVDEVEDVPQSSFTGLPLSDKASYKDQSTVLCLKKWDLHANSMLQCFAYNKHYHKLQGLEFLHDLFNSAEVQQSLQRLVKFQSGKKQTDISYDLVPASITHMGLFDRLYEHGIARKDGAIVKCMEDYINGYQVSDKLREMLLDEASENVELYNVEEKKELLFCIFEHLCLGGAVNQFEDNVDGYLKVAKLIYKDLVSVHKNATTSQVEVSSAVYKVSSISPGQLFPHHSSNNFCYVSIDTHKRQCKLWYHAFTPFW